LNQSVVFLPHADFLVGYFYPAYVMAAKDYSRYQQKVIKRFYDNREQIDDQNLGELVTSLYLATDKQKPKLWLRAKDILDRMELPQARVDHAMESEDAAVLARIVEELQNGKLKRGSGKKKTP